MKIFFNNILNSPYQNFGSYTRDNEKRKEVKQEIRKNEKSHSIDTKTSNDPSISKWDKYYVAQGANGIKHISKTLNHPLMPDAFLIYEEESISQNGVLTHQSETKSNIKTGKIAEKHTTYYRKNGSTYLDREQYFDPKNQNEIFCHTKFYYADTPSLHKEVYKSQKGENLQIAYKEFRENGNLAVRAKTVINFDGTKFSFERSNRDGTSEKFKTFKPAGFENATRFEHTKISATSNLPVKKAVMDTSEIEGDKLSLKYYCPNTNSVCRKTDTLFSLNGKPSFFEGEINEDGIKKTISADFDDESGELIYFEETQKEKDGTTSIYEYRDGKHKFTTTKILENDILCEIVWSGDKKEVNVTYKDGTKESHVLPNEENFDYSPYDEFCELVRRADKTRKRLFILNNLQNSYTSY